MGVSEYAAVIVNFSRRLSPEDPANQLVLLLEVDELYSLARVREFMAANEHIWPDTWVYREKARFPSIEAVLDYAEANPRDDGLPPLTGWVGPMRLVPLQEVAPKVQ